MNIAKMSLLSTTLLGLSLASVHATAGNCAGATYHSIHGYGPSPVSYYQPAVYRGPSAQPGMRAMRVGHHGGVYGKSMAAASQQDIVDIAAVVSFLFSEQAGWMTGRILHVDGGLSAARLL